MRLRFPCTGDSYWLVPAFGHFMLDCASAVLGVRTKHVETYITTAIPAKLFTAWGEIEVPASQVLAFNEALSKVPFWQSVRLRVRALHHVFLHQKCNVKVRDFEETWQSTAGATAHQDWVSMPWAKPKTYFPWTKTSSQMHGLQIRECL